jgi:hypothetical protein
LHWATLWSIFSKAHLVALPVNKVVNEKGRLEKVLEAREIRLIG